MKQAHLNRVNIGCGMTLTEGWINLDNSFSLKLSKYSTLSKVLFKVGLLTPSQYDYIKFCIENEVQYADATKRIPLPDESVDVVYSSHMVEHLSRAKVPIFLREVRRVLEPNGVLRLVLPDLQMAVASYNQNKDADAFMESLLVEAPNIESHKNKLKVLVSGYRHHQWMYDGKSLAKLLEENRFVDVSVLKAGETTITNPAPLDLHERSEQSVYVEGRKPR